MINNKCVHIQSVLDKIAEHISDACTAPDLAQCRDGGSCTAGEGCTIDVGFTDNVVTSMFVQAHVFTHHLSTVWISVEMA